MLSDKSPILQGDLAKSTVFIPIIELSLLIFC